VLDYGSAIFPSYPSPPTFPLPLKRAASAAKLTSAYVFGQACRRPYFAPVPIRHGGGPAQLPLNTSRWVIFSETAPLLPFKNVKPPSSSLTCIIVS